MPSNDHIRRRRAAQRNAALRKQRQALLIITALLAVVLVILACCVFVLLSGHDEGNQQTIIPTPTTIPTPKPTTVSTTAPTTVPTQPGAVDPCLNGHTYKNGFCIYCATHDLNYNPCEKGHTFRNGYCIYCLELDPNYDPCEKGHTFRNGYCVYCLERDPEWRPGIPSAPTTVPTTPPDTVSPVIEVVPFVDHSVYLEDSIPYKSYVTYSDDKTPADKLALQVDRSNVDITKAGTYDVIYTVTDEAGNTASVTIQLTIKAKPTGYVEPEVAYGYAKQVLAQITNDNMSKAEVAAAIYNYVKLNIGYSGSSDKNRGWAAGAVDGFTKHAGDCYTYYATAKALYDVAGIPNVDVVKVKTPQTSQSAHYWSLIDIGDGWYHVDCTPRANNYTESFFLYTDEEMLAYSRNNKNCFNFDLDAYPARETESVQSHIKMSSRGKISHSSMLNQLS